MTHEENGGLYNFLAILVAALGSFTYGFNSAVIGAVFGLPSFFSYFDLTLDGPKSAPMIGAANGLFAGGGLIGCIIVPWISNRVGRVRAIQIICVLGVTSAALQTASVHIGMFLAGRFLNGIASGMINSTVPVYQSEISPPHNRGKLVSTHGIFLVLGYTASAFSGLGCYFSNNAQLQWRLCLALQMVAPLLLGLASPWIPESPRWCVMKGQSERALAILRRLHPGDASGASHNDFAQAEFTQISQQLAMQEESQSIWKLLKNPVNRKRFFLGIFVQFITQSSGILVVNNYQIMLWQSLGMKDYMPSLLYAVYLAWASCLNVVSSQIVDRVGRVRLLFIGVSGLVVMLSVFTGLFATYSGTDNKTGNAMCIMSLFLWLTFYATCIDSVSFVYCSEIFPTQIRSQGMAASVGTLFSVTLLYTQVAATAFADIGWKYYLVFIVVPAVGLPVLYQFPETKGLTLEEIAVRLGDESSNINAISDAEKRQEGRSGSVENVEDASVQAKTEMAEQSA